MQLTAHKFLAMPRNIRTACFIMYARFEAEAVRLQVELDCRRSGLKAKPQESSGFKLKPLARSIRIRILFFLSRASKAGSQVLPKLPKTRVT